MDREEGRRTKIRRVGQRGERRKDRNELELIS